MTITRNRCRGVALLTVMLIMMLLTTLVVYMVEEEHLSIRRVANLQDTEQAFHLAVYSEQWARQLLEEDARNGGTDHLGEAWNSEAPVLEEPAGAALRVEIEDLQGRFNLNNLAAGRDDTWYPLFQRLLTVLQLEPGLADAVVDWVDADINVSGHAGAEDAEYLLKTPPYRAANRRLAYVDELSWIHGVNEEAIRVLRPHVTALPASAAVINVNTASMELIRALTTDILDAASAESLVAGRGEEGYASVSEFLARAELAGQGDQVEPLIGVGSEYFQSRGQVEYGRYGSVLYSLIERLTGSGQTRVIQRRRGLS